MTDPALRGYYEGVRRRAQSEGLTSLLGQSAEQFEVQVPSLCERVELRFGREADDPKAARTLARECGLHWPSSSRTIDTWG